MYNQRYIFPSCKCNAKSIPFGPVFVVLCVSVFDKWCYISLFPYCAIRILLQAKQFIIQRFACKPIVHCLSNIAERPVKSLLQCLCLKWCLSMPSYFSVASVHSPVCRESICLLHIHQTITKPHCPFANTTIHLDWVIPCCGAWIKFQQSTTNMVSLNTFSAFGH